MAPSASQSLSCPSVPPHSQPRTDGQPVGPEHKFTEFFSFCIRSMYINYAPIRMRIRTSTHNTRNVTLCLAYKFNSIILLPLPPSTHTHLVPDVVSFPPDLWQFVREGSEEKGEELVEVRVPVAMVTIIRSYTHLRYLNCRKCGSTK